MARCNCPWAVAGLQVDHCARSPRAAPRIGRADRALTGWGIIGIWVLVTWFLGSVLGDWAVGGILMRRWRAARRLEWVITIVVACSRRTDAQPTLNAHLCSACGGQQVYDAGVQALRCQGDTRTSTRRRQPRAGIRHHRHCAGRNAAAGDAAFRAARVADSCFYRRRCRIILIATARWSLARPIWRQPP